MLRRFCLCNQTLFCEGPVVQLGRGLLWGPFLAFVASLEYVSVCGPLEMVHVGPLDKVWS